MRKLYKNSFFSFFKNKIAISLLIIIVFISTTVFTMFESASSSFSKSYNNVVTKGKLHDYTINEKYSVIGDLKYKDQKVKDINISNPVSVSDVNSEYYLLNSKKEQSAVIELPVKINGKSVSVFGTMKIKDIKNIKSLTKLDFTPFFKVGKETISNDNNTSSKIELVEDDFASSSKSKIYSDGYGSIQKSDGWGGFTPADSLHFDQSSFGKQLDLKTLLPIAVPKTNIKIELIDKDLDEFKLRISNWYKNKIEKLLSGDFVVKSTILDKTNSSGMYKDYITSHKSKELFFIQQLPDPSNSNPNQIDTNIKIMLKNKNIKNDGSNTSIYDLSSTWEAGKNKIKSEIDSNIISEHSKEFNDFLTNSFGDEIYTKSVKSLFITAGSKKFKVINNGAETHNVDELQIFKGQNMPKKLEASKTAQNRLGGNIIDRGYKAIEDSLFSHRMLYNPSSLFAVASQGYMKANNLKPMSPFDIDVIMKVLSQKTNSLYGAEEDCIWKAFVETDIASVKKLQTQFKDSILMIDNTPFFITGSGTTPDFSYPIIAPQAPIPDASNQALVFTNDLGYKRIEDAFRGNDEENYIALKFKENVSNARREQIISDIHKKTVKLMSWPSNIDPVSSVDSSKEKINLAPQRIKFLTKINSMVTTISWLTISLLSIFTGIIVILVIRKQISNRRKILGTLLANGYSKSSIAFSMSVIGLIVASVSSIVGYITGHFLQFAFIRMFDNYWTLPIWDVQFSWLSLFLTVFIPLVSISLLTFSITLYELRGSIVSILNGKIKKLNFIGAGMMKAFNWFGIKWKTSFSIFSSNMGKMVLSIVSFAAVISSIGIAFTTYGKFDYALNKSTAPISYQYKIDLVSPTDEAGLYKRLSLPTFLRDENGKEVNLTTSKDSKDIIYPTGVNAKYNLDADPSNDGHLLFIPKPADVKNMSSMDFLKYKVQSKVFMNDLSSAGGLAWGKAVSLMPENQKNQAQRQYADFIYYGYKLALKSKNQAKYKTFNTEEDIREVISNSGITGLLIQDDQKDKEEFVFNALTSSIKAYEKGKRDTPLPYFIIYHGVLMDEDDKTYTHIDSTYKYTNPQNNGASEELQVSGITEDSNGFVKLSPESWKSLNNFKSTSDIIPIITNKYFNALHNVQVGSVIESTLLNHKNRFQDVNARTIKYKIVGTENTYDQKRVYTKKTYANNALGWNDKEMFNGVYSKNKDEILFKHINLYSESNTYFGFDRVSDKNAANPTSAGYAMKSFFENNDMSKFNPALPNPTGGNWQQTYKSFVDKYGVNPMLMVNADVDWAKTTNFSFHATLNLASKLIWLIESIVLIIAVLFVALISTMIIDDNKKYISTLKVMGYKNKEISKIFARIFVPVILIATAISIPLIMAVTNLMKYSIMEFGNILIPLNMMGWEVIASTLILITMFITIYISSTYKMIGSSLLVVFKE